MRVVMQPARRSESAVAQHYEDTIVRPVEFDRHADVLERDVLGQLRRLFPSGAAQMWGVVPGVRGVNLSKIRRMSPGDWVFFSGDKRLYFGGRIALLWHNPELAARLWGTDTTGSTWEHMYALTDTREFDVPIEDVRRLLGWKDSRNIMGISVLSDDESELLSREYSLAPRPAIGGPALAGLHSDGSSAEDLLDNSAEVERLAQLALATSTTAPLAIALLGKWGSGKSSFMDQMNRRVEQIAQLSAQADGDSSAFAANVRQVRFNAWHYSDETVWSGLLEHLFQVLAASPDDVPSPSDDVDVERQKRGAQLAKLEKAQRRLDTRLSRAAKARPVGFLAWLGSPREWVHLVLPALRQLASEFFTYAVLAGAVVLASGAAIFWGRHLIHPWISALVGFLGSASWVAGMWRAARAWQPGQSKLIDKVRGQLSEVQRDLQSRVTSARARLAEVDAAASLADFLADRSASDSYQQYRGVLGKVHDDLTKLHQALSAARDEWVQADRQQRPPLQRIILYIDDLDRCSPGRVVEVLSAVHLMLALPLFVVVVAVDPRWLLRCLEDHHRGLLTQAGPGSDDVHKAEVATPIDYLDKIFQVPFAVPPTTPAKTASYIRALLGDPEGAVPEPDGIDPEAQDPTAEGGAPQASGDGARPVPAGSPAESMDLNPSQLRLTSTEIAFMGELGALLSTPRAAKKLVNLYRLVRIGVADGDLPTFVGDPLVGPGDYQPVQVLLALLVGHPKQARHLFRHILSAGPSEKITDVLRGMPPELVPVASGAASTLEAINATMVVNSDTAAYQRWCSEVARFSFHTENLTA